MIKIKYPQNITNSGNKTAFLYRTQELLRLEHNKHGKDFREGKITEKKWEDYLKIFDKKSDSLISDILKYRNMLKNDKTINDDLSNSFEE